MSLLTKCRFACIAIFTISVFCVQNTSGSAKNVVYSNSSFIKQGAPLMSETFDERFKYPPPVEYLGDLDSFDQISSSSLISIRNNLKKRRYLVGIFIDHTKLTRLSGSASKAYIVQPGLHELQVGNDDVASPPLTVETKSGETKFFEFVSLPQRKLSEFFLGPTHLKLQQLK